MPKHSATAAVSLSNLEAMEAVRTAGLNKGWKIAEEAPDSVTFREGRKWSGVTHPVTVTAHVTDKDDGSEVEASGSVGGLGPIQSKHVQRQVTEFIAMVTGHGGAPADAGGLTAATANPDLLRRISHLHSRVTTYLGENLREGEQIKVLIDGGANQVIVGTDSRLFVIKVGWLAGATRGVEATSWSYRNVLGIQTHKGMVTGAVIVQGPGQGV
jgi:hypothetical protein